MADEQVATPGQDGTPAPVSGETPQTQAAPPSALPAATPGYTPEVQAEIDRRVETEKRRLQSVKDREVAEERRKAQSQARAAYQAAKTQWVEAGRAPEEFDQMLSQQSKLAFADEVLEKEKAEAEALALAQVHLRAAGLHKYGIQPDDPRLYGKFSNWEDYDDALDAIRREEEAKARASEKAAAEEAEKTALQKRIESGELSTLGAAPAGTGGGPDLSKYKITDSRDLYRLGLQQEQARRGRR